METALLRIQAGLLDHILAHVRASAPLEACGLLAGCAGQALAVYPLPNALRSPLLYEAEAEALLAAILDIEARGWHVVGIYHSHPAGPCEPSAVDIARAYYPEAAYVIVSLAHEPPQVRAFRIVAGQVSPLGLLVE